MSVTIYEAKGLVIMESKKPFHETVAEKLIDQLKAGTAPWQKPWEPGQSGAFIPTNPITGKRYRGINAIHLMSQGHSDQRWMTYNQAKSIGTQVRKGENGTPIQYWKFRDEQIKTDADGKPVLDAQGEPVKEWVTLERPKVFLATVFNATQIDGELPLQQPRKQHDWTAVERAEKIINASGALIRHGEQNRAFYRSSTDSIHLPDKGQFPQASGYYAITLHELGHWTGHKSRLDRDLSNPFGTEGYAKEELRAEIASMILGDELGIGRDPGQHAAYVDSWIKVLQNEPLEIFRAAADAEKINGYLLGLELQQVQQQGVTAMQSHEPKAAGVETLADPDMQRRIAQFESGQKTYIQVPYHEKDEAKALGAKWDRQKLSWYVPNGANADAFAKWARGAAAADTGAPDAGQTVQEGAAQSRKDHQEREYLAVPYGERIAAKAAGAEWDKVAKSWYAGPKADMEKLARWKLGNVPNQQGPAMTPQQEFADALRAIGCVVSGEHPIMDGNKHRISVEGEKVIEKAGSGFYVGHLDGHPAGYMKNNKTGVDMKWKSKGYALNPEDKARMAAEAAAKLQVREVGQAKVYEQTAQRVSRQMADLVPVEEPTPYMKAKGIQPQAGAFADRDGQTTYIPATDVNGKQWTMQYIQEDGTKRFAKDSRKEGCFHVVGGGVDTLAQVPALVIGEGYATASSLSQSLGFATVAAFDSGNLPAVAKVLHEKFPDKPIIIAGDDDRHLELTQGVNPGKTKAQEAAKMTGGTVILPIFAPSENSYSADLPPVTPEKFREHQRTGAALSEQQLVALDQMKGKTDYNDLANKSVLGKEGIDRQVRAAVHDVIDKHQASVKQQRAQRQDQQQVPPRRSAKIR